MSVLPLPLVAQSLPFAEREFRIVIHGDAIPKGRGRPRFVNGRPVGVILPEKTRAYQDIVRQRATVEWNGAPLLDGVPITLHVVFFRRIGESWPKKRREAAIVGDVRPTSKPDLDNLEKAIKDGLNGVVWRDDALVCEKHSAKYYALEPRVEIRLTW